MQIGDKVICVDDDWSKCWDDPRKWFDGLPKNGKVYVIRETGIAKNGEAMVKVVGITSPHPGGGFYPHRFRLLSEMKQEAATVNRVEAVCK